jgi:putative toxin-antitoxin system antitoxin component (TIGR02293 family)
MEAVAEKYAPTQVREGLSFKELEQLVNLLGLPLHEVAGLLLVSERTLSRRRQEGRFTQAESDRLVRLIHLVRQAIEAFDNTESAIEWLTTPKTLLDGETPLKRADTQPGLQMVEDMLGVIQYTMPA